MYDINQTDNHPLFVLKPSTYLDLTPCKPPFLVIKKTAHIIIGFYFLYKNIKINNNIFHEKYQNK
jgi:hypothetical protein